MSPVDQSCQDMSQSDLNQALLEFKRATLTAIAVRREEELDRVSFEAMTLETPYDAVARHRSIRMRLHGVMRRVRQWFGR